MYEKQELKALQQLDKNTQQIYVKNTNIHMKKRSVSLSHTRILGSNLFRIQQSKNKNTQTLQVKHLRCD